MSPEELVGRELGKSVLRRLLGQGTMGAVYLASQGEHQVAVKVFLPCPALEQGEREEFLKRLEENIKQSASLNHPHILPILEYGKQADLVYVVTPFIAGESLETLLKRSGTLPLSRITALLTQLAEAVDYAHTHGVLHRDIKVANILLTPEGSPLLSDFGLAGLTTEKNFAKARRAVPGMLDAIAPEYVLGKALDPRADLYSLGAVLYQMVTGEPLFSGNSLSEVAMKHVKDTPCSPCFLRAELPQAAERVMLRALARRPANRYAHARDLASAFRLALEEARPITSQKTATSTASKPGISPKASASQVATSTPVQKAARRAPSSSAVAQKPDVPQEMMLTTLPKLKALDTPTPDTFEPRNAQETDALQKPLADRPGSDAPTAPTLPKKIRALDLLADLAGNTTTGVRPETAQSLPRARAGGLFDPKWQTYAPLSPPETGQEKDANATTPLANSETITGVSPVLQTHTQVEERGPREPIAAQALTGVSDENTSTPSLDSSEFTQSPTEALTTLASIPYSDSGVDKTTTIKLTKSFKIVQVPVADQPGQFITGFLPLVSQEEKSAPPSKRPNRARLIASLLLASLVILTGSGIFLALHNQHKSAALVKTHVAPVINMDAQATATANANIIVSDDLSQNTHNWPVCQQGGYSCVFKDGAYHLTNKDQTKSALSLLPGKVISQPFAYSLTMEQIKGDETSPNNQFGMILDENLQTLNGKQVATFYAFEVVNEADGQYQFWKYDNRRDGSPWGDNPIWSGKLGPEFRQGSGAAHVNTVKVVANGTLFTFTVNGKKVGSAKDGSFSSGSVGMLVNLDGAEVAFSHFLVTHM